MIKNITFSAENSIIEKARIKARAEGTSLNDKFKEWVQRYVGARENKSNYVNIMKKLKKIKVGRKFSREEANAR